jgi:predicted kinase
MTQILLITGPAGVGKTTLNWEVSSQLASSNVRHAAIETDELDRVFPLPSASEMEDLRPEMTDISEINLASIWQNYHALGCDRLILSGVMVFVDEAKKWIARAIPKADFTVVRLVASEETLLGRLERREIGSGLDDQIRRTLKQARLISTLANTDLIELQTDGRTPQEIASELLQRIGWLPCRKSRSF